METDPRTLSVWEELELICDEEIPLLSDDAREAAADALRFDDGGDLSQSPVLAYPEACRLCSRVIALYERVRASGETDAETFLADAAGDFIRPEPEGEMEDWSDRELWRDLAWHRPEQYRASYLEELRKMTPFENVTVTTTITRRIVCRCPGAARRTQPRRHASRRARAPARDAGGDEPPPAEDHEGTDEPFDDPFVEEPA